MANTSFNPGGGGGGGDNNESSFKTVSAGPVNDAIVADTTTDTLNLSAMGGVKIYTHPTTDTVCISALDRELEVLDYTTKDIYTSFSDDPDYSKVVTLLHFNSGSSEGGESGVHDDSYRANNVNRILDAALSSTQKKFGDTSMYLDGSAWLAIECTDSLQYRLDDYDWTIEGWFYPAATGVNEGLINQSSGGAASNSSFILYRDSANNVGIYTTENTGWDNSAVTTDAPMDTANQWYHIAAVRSGTSLMIFVDGILKTTTTVAAGMSIPGSSMDLEIGCQNSGANFNGYVDEVRFTIGRARYTSTFTVPSEAFSGQSQFDMTVVTGVSGSAAPLLSATAEENVLVTTTTDSYWNDVVLLAGFNMNETLSANDTSKYKHALKVTGDSPTLSATGKFDGSIYFDGDDNYRVDANSLFDFSGRLPFTVEAWAKTSSTSHESFMSHFDSDSPYSGWELGIGNPSKKATAWLGGAWLAGTTDINDNAWHHVALTFDGETYNLWVDGVSENTSTDISVDSGPGDKLDLTIGADSNATPGRKYTGWLDEIRVTRGVDRYTSTFTPHTVQHPRPTDKVVTLVTGVTGAGGISSGSSEISFGAHRNGVAQSIPGSSTPTLVQFNVADFDIGNKYSISSYKFTPGIAGRYFLTAGVNFDNIDSGNDVYLYITKNGSTIVTEGQHTYVGYTDPFIDVTAIVQATSTDYYQVYVAHSDVVSRDLHGTSTGTYFQGFRIS